MNEIKVIICECGFKVQGKNHYEAEAMFLYHTIHRHPQRANEMSVEDLEKFLRNNDKQTKTK
jgi:hypothetical protein